jgi:hypothetical protein
VKPVATVCGGPYVVARAVVATTAAVTHTDATIAQARPAPSRHFPFIVINPLDDRPVGAGGTARTDRTSTGRSSRST